MAHLGNHETRPAGVKAGRATFDYVCTSSGLLPQARPLLAPKG
jgi:hypothetical protein